MRRGVDIVGAVLTALLCGCSGAANKQPPAPVAMATDDLTAPPNPHNLDCQGSYSQSGSIVDTSAPLRGNIALSIRGGANGRDSIQSVRNGASDGPPAVATDANGLNAVFNDRVTIRNLSLGSLMSGTLVIPGGNGNVMYLINGFCGPAPI